MYISYHLSIEQMGAKLQKVDRFHSHFALVNGLHANRNQAPVNTSQITITTTVITVINIIITVINAINNHTYTAITEAL